MYKADIKLKISVNIFVSVHISYVNLSKISLDVNFIYKKLSLFYFSLQIILLVIMKILHNFKNKLYSLLFTAI